ncbi:MAG: glycosyltransferase family 2 protein [Candidatus Pacearchaeota archaeon]
MDSEKMNEKICIVSTVRSNKKTIEQWINYHLNIGVDKIFLFLDKRNKNIKGLINLKKKYGKKVSFFYSEDHKSSIEIRQRKNSIKALKIALNENFDWICHLDIDELIYFKEKMKNSLSKVSKKYDYIRLPTLEAVIEKENYKNPFYEIKLFKNNFWKFSKIFFNAHIAGKSITRVKPYIMDLGIHQPNSNKKLKWTILPFNAYILHFYCVNFKDFLEKWRWRIDGSGVAREMGKRGERILSLIDKKLKKGKILELKDFYKKKFISPKKFNNLLTLLRVYKNIELNRKLFLWKNMTS